MIKPTQINEFVKQNIFPILGNISHNTHITCFTGAGISAESGIQTFRDQGGLWEQHRIEDVATPEAFDRNTKKVLQFYNKRRQQLRNVKPGIAHYALADLQEKARVQVITQNVDNLHEKAGSHKVLHLHGELMKAESSGDKGYIIPLGNKDIELGDTCPRGFQLRPHVVWFGEMVPNMERAQEMVHHSELLIVVGTSLNVYPAAGLLHFVQEGTPIVVIDPQVPELEPFGNVHHIKATASVALPALVDAITDV